MKINIVILGFAIVLSALIAYAFYAAGTEVLRSVFLGLSFTYCWGLFMAVSVSDKPRTTTWVRIVGFLSVIIMIVVNIIFNIMDVGYLAFYIVNLLVIVISLLFTYGLIKTKV